MHHIQYSIVDQLIKNKKCRFSQLKPSGVESNLFQYHLKHTIKEGYVEKVEGGYTLSTRGLQYADKHSSSLRAVRAQPKIITVIVLHNARGEVLLIPKKKQPFIGDYHLPAGKVHSGEQVLSAAARELSEKAGIDTVGLEHGGMVHVQIVSNGLTISEYFGFVVVGQYDGRLPADGTWWSQSDIDTTTVPSVREVVEYTDQSGAEKIAEIYINLGE